MYIRLWIFGFGYSADDSGTDQPVAMKLPRLEVLQDPEERQRPIFFLANKSRDYDVARDRPGFTVENVDKTAKSVIKVSPRI